MQFCTKLKITITIYKKFRLKTFMYERIPTEYNLERYEILCLNIGRNDPGRLLILYIKIELPTFDINFEEYLSIDIKLNGKDKLSLTSIYRSPSADE